MARALCWRASRYPPRPSTLGSSAFLTVSQQQSRKLRRSFQSSSNDHNPPDFAFAFDVDGVLLRSSNPLPGASTSLRYLQQHGIPFILLTNGGGKTEEQRVSDISRHLDLTLDTDMFIQSHTPFAQLVNGYNGAPPLKDKCVLVLGGEGNQCRDVAERYGFTNVITSGDLITEFPSLWPIANHRLYNSHARPLRRRIASSTDLDALEEKQSLRVDAIFVFHDPRDWALDTQILLDLLLSHKGYLGTLSPKNGDANLSNRGYQQDDQPRLYFSNPDLWWASEYHLDRLGQGGFREAFEGVWNAVTGGPANDVQLQKAIFGKPSYETYSFAERKLDAHRKMLLGEKGASKSSLQCVYMVGDNPASDIQGANDYVSPSGTDWPSILVKTGVYKHGKPEHEPKIIVPDVTAAVQWALKKSAWPEPLF